MHRKAVVRAATFILSNSVVVVNRTRFDHKFQWINSYEELTCVGRETFRANRIQYFDEGSSLQFPGIECRKLVHIECRVCRPSLPTMPELSAPITRQANNALLATLFFLASKQTYKFLLQSHRCVRAPHQVRTLTHKWMMSCVVPKCNKIRSKHARNVYIDRRTQTHADARRHTHIRAHTWAHTVAHPRHNRNSSHFLFVWFHVRRPYARTSHTHAQFEWLRACLCVNVFVWISRHC